MLIRIDRYMLLPDRIIGRYAIDEPMGFTLELPPGVGKHHAIPAGLYRVRMRSWVSTKFHRNMPEIVAVPGHDDILFHWGNKPKDTDGCVLTGLTLMDGPIDLAQSKLAFDVLVGRIEDAERAGEEVWTEISESFHTRTPEVM